jgi:hypothetical protein
VHESDARQTIPANFVGLSYEKSDIARPGMFTGANSKLRNLLTNFGTGVLRFGGGSVEETDWAPAGNAQPGSNTITPNDYANLAAFAQSAGWKLIIGLRLAHFDPAAAASEAASASQAAGASLLSFEIGNEPDEYPRQGLKQSYSYTDFRTDFEAYAGAIKNAVPSATFSGPATADLPTVQTWTAPFLRDEGAQVAFASHHTYPLGPTNLEPAGSSRYATVSSLLSPATMRDVITELDQLQVASVAHGKQYRITETNSTYAGGQKGVSDVFASALWAVDYLFTLAQHNAQGADFHVGYNATYAPILRQNGDYLPQPLYYGMLFFHTAAQGRLVNSVLQSNGANASAYATKQSGGVSVTIVNKEPARALDVRISTEVPYTQASTLRLTAASLTSQSGVLLGGGGIGSDGRWAPSYTADATVSGTSIVVHVAAATAVLVRLR